LYNPSRFRVFVNDYKIHVSMKVIVSDIPKEGIEFSGQETAEAIGLTSDEVEGCVEVSARILKEGESLFIEGELQATRRLLCSRCTAEFLSPIRLQFSCRGETASRYHQHQEIELHRGDMDVHYFAGDTIEVNDIFREQIVLSVPMRPLCREDCKGLCPICGQDLNIGRCSCDRDSNDPRWLELKKMFHSS
jgi:uncharacterized protein